MAPFCMLILPLIPHSRAPFFLTGRRRNIMPPETLRFHIPCRGAVREDDMRGNFKDAFKLLAIVATAAGLVALAPAQAKAKAAATAVGVSANHRHTTSH